MTDRHDRPGPPGVESMAARFQDMAGGRSGPELELARGIVRRFPGKAIALIDALAQAARAGDPAALRHAHSLKGAALLIGHPPMAALGLQAEELCEAGQYGAVLDRVPELRVALDDWGSRLAWLAQNCPGFTPADRDRPPASPERAIRASGRPADDVSAARPTEPLQR